MLRLSWSPDGHYLVSAHAMNNSGPTAQIIEREGWKTNMDFVGHRKAVTVVVSVLRVVPSEPGQGCCPRGQVTCETEMAGSETQHASCSYFIVNMYVLVLRNYIYEISCVFMFYSQTVT